MKSPANSVTSPGRNAVKWMTILSIVALLNTSCMGNSSTAVKVEQSAPGPALKILCTFLPVYELAANVLMTRKNISLEVLVPPSSGVEPRSYTLTPADQARLASADVLIINGLGIDAQIEEAARKVNKDVYIIDTSAGIAPIESETGPNPYIWMSPRCAAAQAMNIEKEIYAHDPQGAPEVKKKREVFVKMLNKLQENLPVSGPIPGAGSAPEASPSPGASEAPVASPSPGTSVGAVASPSPGASDAPVVSPAPVESAVPQKERIKVIAQGEFFDYLARDCGLEIVEHLPAQEVYGEKKLQEALPRLKELGARAIIVRSAGNSSHELALSRKIPVCFFDILLSGSTYPDAYHRAMTRGLDSLKVLISSK